MAGKRPTMSAAERALRSNTKAIVERVENGATPIAAMGMSGYSRWHARRILKIAEGGEPDVTDGGYRKACEALSAMLTVATATVDQQLADRWTAIATKGDDWRSIAELLKRRNPEEWAVTERSEVELAGGVEVRTNDAVLEALAALRGESAA